MKKVTAYRVKLFNVNGDEVINDWPCPIQKVEAFPVALCEGFKLEITLESGEYVVDE